MIQSLPFMPVAAQPASGAGRALRRSAHVTDCRKPMGVCTKIYRPDDSEPAVHAGCGATGVLAVHAGCGATGVLQPAACRINPASS